MKNSPDSKSGAAPWGPALRPAGSPHPLAIDISARTLLDLVDSALAEVFAGLSLPKEFARAAFSGKPELADLQCNGAMPAAKKLGQNPQQIAGEVAAALSQRAEFSKIEVAGPGFINMGLSPVFLSRLAMAQLEYADLCIRKAQPAERFIVDFGGPNVAKPLHVGHLRSLVIGESLRRILLAVGHHVVSDVHLGDWGLQMGQLISELAVRQPGLPYFDPRYEGSYPKSPPVTLAALEAMYPAAAAACKEDPARLELARKATADLQVGRPGYVALWRQFRELSLAAQTKDFAALGAHFDLFLGESDADPLIEPMIADLTRVQLAVVDDEALVIRVAEPADGKRPLPPLILRKRDGAATYATTDLATIFQRVSGDKPADHILYVVDQRQADHFKQVFRAAAKAGISARLVHVGFGTVNGPGNKALKTRDGGTVKLADLLDEAIAKAAERVEASQKASALSETERHQLAREVGIAAVKFADLSSNRVSGYVFDAERLVSFEGRTGPYMQYACARIASILAKADERGDGAGDIVVAHATERALVLDCLRFPEIVASASASLLPNEIAEYAFNLAQGFSRFYTECQVLGEAEAEIRASRLSLCRLAHRVLSRALDLLGIDVPKRM